jgi:hypothetical protein
VAERLLMGLALLVLAWPLSAATLLWDLGWPEAFPGMVATAAITVMAPVFLKSSS